MNKKGQAAMEFLMTYGWAILVVLAAIGALAYFGVLSPDRFMPSKCMVSGGFSCVEYKLDNANDEVRFYLQNNLGVDADEVLVNLSDTNTVDCTSPNITTDASLKQVNLSVMTNGQKQGPVIFDGGCTQSLSSTSFKGTITILYRRSGETEFHSAGGSISGKFD